MSERDLLFLVFIIDRYVCVIFLFWPHPRSPLLYSAAPCTMCGLLVCRVSAWKASCVVVLVAPRCIHVVDARIMSVLYLAAMLS